MVAFAVDEHEGSIRSQPAQGGAIDQIGPIGTVLPGRVEGGKLVVQCLSDVERAGAGDQIAEGQQIHGDRGIGGRGAIDDPARAHHLDRVEDSLVIRFFLRA